MCFSPPVSFFVNLMGLSINGYADVTWLDCRQPSQNGLESSINDSCEDVTVKNCDFPLLSVKVLLTYPPACVSESDDESSTLRVGCSLHLDIDNGLDRTYVLSSSLCAIRFIPDGKVPSKSPCLASSFINEDLFKAK